MEPLGVVAAIIPWNSTLGFIASKVAIAIAAGSTIKLRDCRRQFGFKVLVGHQESVELHVELTVTPEGHVVGAEVDWRRIAEAHGDGSEIPTHHPPTEC